MSTCAALTDREFPPSSKEIARGPMHTTARVLEALTATNERLIGMCHDLRNKGRSSNVTQGMRLRGYKSGPEIQFYVEAELKNEESLCWWLEIQWSQDNGRSMQRSCMIMRGGRIGSENFR